MRELMMKRIGQMIGPYTENEQKFMSMRWMPLGIWLYKLKFDEEYNSTKSQKAFLKSAKLDDFALEYATDEDIVALFEMVCNRYYRQM